MNELLRCFYFFIFFILIFYFNQNIYAQHLTHKSIAPKAKIYLYDHLKGNKISDSALICSNVSLTLILSSPYPLSSLYWFADGQQTEVNKVDVTEIWRKDQVGYWYKVQIPKSNLYDYQHKFTCIYKYQNQKNSLTSVKWIKVINEKPLGIRTRMRKILDEYQLTAWDNTFQPVYKEGITTWTLDGQQFQGGMECKIWFDQPKKYQLKIQKQIAALCPIRSYSTTVDIQTFTGCDFSHIKVEEKLLTGRLYEKASTVIPIDDNRFFLYGNSQNLGIQSNDLFFMVMDMQGRISAQKIIDSNEKDLSVQAIETKQGEWLGVAEKINLESGTKKIQLIKYDKTLQKLLFFKELEVNANLKAQKILPLEDESFVLFAVGTEDKNIYIHIFSIDKNGTILWNKKIDKNKGNVVLDAYIEKKSIFIASEHINKKKNKWFLTQFNFQGKQLSSKIFPKKNFFPLKVERFKRQHLLWSVESKKESTSLIASKISDSGKALNILDIKVPYSLKDHHLLKTPSDHYIWVGSLKNNLQSETHILLTKVDVNGNVLWKQKIIKEGLCTIKSINQINGSYLLFIQQKKIYQKDKLLLLRVSEVDNLIFNKLEFQLKKKDIVCRKNEFEEMVLSSYSPLKAIHFKYPKDFKWMKITPKLWCKSDDIYYYQIPLQVTSLQDGNNPIVSIATTTDNIAFTPASLNVELRNIQRADFYYTVDQTDDFFHIAATDTSQYNTLFSPYYNKSWYLNGKYISKDPELEISIFKFAKNELILKTDLAVPCSIKSKIVTMSTDCNLLQSWGQLEILDKQTSKPLSLKGNQYDKNKIKVKFRLYSQTPITYFVWYPVNKKDGIKQKNLLSTFPNSQTFDIPSSILHQGDNQIIFYFKDRVGCKYYAMHNIPIQDKQDQIASYIDSFTQTLASKISTHSIYLLHDSLDCVTGDIKVRIDPESIAYLNQFSTLSYTWYLNGKPYAFDQYEYMHIKVEDFIEKSQHLLALVIQNQDWVLHEETILDRGQVLIPSFTLQQSKASFCKGQTLTLSNVTLFRGGLPSKISWEIWDNSKLYERKALLYDEPYKLYVRGTGEDDKLKSELMEIEMIADTGSCSSKISKSFLIHDNPILTATTDKALIFCNNVSYSTYIDKERWFENIDRIKGDWELSVDQKTISFNQFIPSNYNIGKHRFKISLNRRGCKSQILVPFRVVKAPKFQFVHTAFFNQKVGTLQIQIDKVGGKNYSIEWDDKVFADQRNVYNPTVTLVDKQTFRITVKNIYGCSVTSATTIRVFNQSLPTSLKKLPNANLRGFDLRHLWDYFPTSTMAIYDSLGNQLYESIPNQRESMLWTLGVKQKIDKNEFLSVLIRLDEKRNKNILHKLRID